MCIFETGRTNLWLFPDMWKISDYHHYQRLYFWALGALFHLYKSRPGEAIDTILGLDFMTLNSCQGFVLFPIQTLKKVFSKFHESYHWTILFSMWTLETESDKFSNLSFDYFSFYFNWYISAHLIRAVCSSA